MRCAVGSADFCLWVVVGARSLNVGKAEENPGCAMRMLAKVLAVLLGAVVVMEGVETVLMMWGLRSGNSRAIRLVTLYHKHVTNPVMVRFFSGRSAHAALLHHVGRRSGKAYSTPLTAHRSEDTIIVPLPYGTEVDWLRNLQAAGQGVVELEGRSVTVDQPEVLPVDRVIALLPSFVTRLVHLHDTKHALQLHVAGPAERLEPLSTKRGAGYGNVGRA